MAKKLVTSRAMDPQTVGLAQFRLDPTALASPGPFVFHSCWVCVVKIDVGCMITQGRKPHLPVGLGKVIFSLC